MDVKDFVSMERTAKATVHGWSHGHALAALTMHNLPIAMQLQSVVSFSETKCFNTAATTTVFGMCADSLMMSTFQYAIVNANNGLIIHRKSFQYNKMFFHVPSVTDVLFNCT